MSIPPGAHQLMKRRKKVKVDQGVEDEDDDESTSQYVYADEHDFVPVIGLGGPVFTSETSHKRKPHEEAPDDILPPHRLYLEKVEKEDTARRMAKGHPSGYQGNIGHGLPVFTTHEYNKVGTRVPDDVFGPNRQYLEELKDTREKSDDFAPIVGMGLPVSTSEKSHKRKPESEAPDDIPPPQRNYLKKVDRNIEAQQAYRKGEETDFDPTIGHGLPVYTPHEYNETASPDMDDIWPPQRQYMDEIPEDKRT